MAKETTKKTGKNVAPKTTKSMSKVAPKAKSAKAKKMTMNMKKDEKMIEKNMKKGMDKPMDTKMMSMENCVNMTCSKYDPIKIISLILLIAIFIMHLMQASPSKQAVIDGIQETKKVEVGGEAAYKIRQEIYSSDKFKEYGESQAKAALSQINGTPAATHPDTTQAGAEPEDTVKTISMQDVSKVMAGTFIRGDKNAKYVLLEYSDFLCPYCQRQHKDGVISQFLMAYPNDVKTTFITNTRGNPESLKIAVGAECAGDQGKYDDYVNAMFNAGPSVSSIDTIAAQVGVNATTFKKCTDENKYADVVNQKMQDGAKLFGIQGTPGNVLLNTENGEYILIAGAYPVEKFKEVYTKLSAGK